MLKLGVKEVAHVAFYYCIFLREIFMLLCWLFGWRNYSKATTSFMSVPVTHLQLMTSALIWEDRFNWQRSVSCAEQCQLCNTVYNFQTKLKTMLRTAWGWVFTKYPIHKKGISLKLKSIGSIVRVFTLVPEIKLFPLIWQGQTAVCNWAMKVFIVTNDGVLLLLGVLVVPLLNCWLRCHL